MTSGNVRVLVTSVDGNLTHPFKPTDTVAEVQAFAYPRLVRDKAQVPLSATSMERSLPNGTTAPLTGRESIGSLVGPREPGHGNEIDLTLSLVWTSQGGVR
jgi:hypothetical protein